jgi:hypothetical protein
MKRKNQLGQVLLGTAVAMVVLAGFAGLAIDMGTLRYQKRLQQTAADSAAIAGAMNLNFGSGSVTGGRGASTQNGFTDNNSGAGCTGGAVGCVSVKISTSGPTTGPHAGNAAYVEAIVTVIQPTYFMKIFGVNSKPVTARAVATNVKGGTNRDCLYTLGPPTNAIIGIDATGNAKIIAPNCGIADNGNLDTTVGSCIGSHCGSPDVQCYSSPAPNYTCPPIGGAAGSQDPTKNINPPLSPPSQPAASPSCPNPACNWVAASKSTVTLQPGTFNSITVGSNANITMAPGIYYINGDSKTGGLNFQGGGTLTDAGNPGVLIYFTNGSTINKAVGGGNNLDINLLPMTTGTYAGMLFYQNPADTTPAYFGGNDNAIYDGTIYMPTATINFYGNVTQTFNGTVIAYSVATTGNPTVNFGVSPAGVPIPAFLTQPVLVE